MSGLEKVLTVHAERNSSWRPTQRRLTLCVVWTEFHHPLSWPSILRGFFFFFSFLPTSKLAICSRRPWNGRHVEAPRGDKANSIKGTRTVCGDGKVTARHQKPFSGKTGWQTKGRVFHEYFVMLRPQGRALHVKSPPSSPHLVFLCRGVPSAIYAGLSVEDDGHSRCRGFSERSS